LSVSAIMQEDELLAHLEAGTAQAWKAYRERLRELSGEEYERVEPEYWAELQRELRRLERRRKLLSRRPA
jgi:hypothetical protein